MDNADIEDLFVALGSVTIKRMFGGKGVYHQGRIVAVVIGDTLMLRADAVSAPAFAAAGSTQWTYQREGRKRTAWPYWTVPEAAMDDPDLMAVWARRAWDAASRVTAK